MTIRAIDLFAGAGGTSTGLALAAASLGQRVILAAVNHWPIAVETHALNHPWADHHCAAIDSLDPQTVARGKVDLLVASPECTHHSNARGGKPINDQSRASAWCVVRWAEALQPRFALVEPRIADITLRMLAPHELSAAMGFPTGYRFAGTRGEAIKQIGNAVPVSTAQALCTSILRDALGAA
jgi:site-specific DNA-cytosine methylase